jgi:TonB family protein
MAHRPNMSPGPRNLIPSGPQGVPLPAEESHSPSDTIDSESDIAELFAKFEENSGGTLLPQFSADLALDIVLHEIVELACLATGASGAAVVLRRGSGFELVCRASTGASAPALGAQMDARSGLSGLCIQSGQVQRCDDAAKDPRADREASERLGVRSVMVLPLGRPAGMLGILEVLSERPSAFGERDERTLEVLAARVLRNVERAADPFLLRADAAAPLPFTPPRAVQEEVQQEKVFEPAAPEPAPRLREFEAPFSGPIFSGPIFSAPPASIPRSRPDLLTWFLGLILLATMVLMGFLTGRRYGWSLAAVRARGPRVPAQVAPSPQISVAPSAASDAAVSSAPAEATATASQPNVSAKPVATAAPPVPEIPDGDLRIFENGKEVFRIPGSRQSVATTKVTAGAKQEVKETASQAAELSPDAAESNVIHRVEPEYPESALAQKLQGEVVLKIRIEPNGTVEDVQLVSGNPVLAQAAIAAVMQWKFKPQAEGDPARMQTQVTLNFRLPKQ